MGRRGRDGGGEGGKERMYCIIRVLYYSVVPCFFPSEPLLPNQSSVATPSEKMAPLPSVTINRHLQEPCHIWVTASHAPRFYTSVLRFLLPCLSWAVEHGGRSTVGGAQWVGCDASHLRPCAHRPLISALTHYESHHQPSSPSARKEPRSPRLKSHQPVARHISVQKALSTT